MILKITNFEFELFKLDIFFTNQINSGSNYSDVLIMIKTHFDFFSDTSFSWTLIFYFIFFNNFYKRINK